MNKIYAFFEEMLFYPKWYHYPIIILLLPFSLIYMIIIHFLFPRKFQNLGIPIISVGNIVVGGSGKTPFSISLANYLKDFKPAVILRGYKRKSKGLVIVSNSKEILCDVEKSGDEAMEIAKKTNAIVIVSEDRKEAILKAKELGSRVVILDDGFDKPFEKLNIVIDKKIKNPFCLPAGGYRYPRIALRFADIIVKEGIDFKRKVTVPDGDILISAISNPQRLLKYWDKEYKFFPDHYQFKDLSEFKDKKIVTTYKDYVKLEKFSLDLRVIDLEVEISSFVLDKIFQYLLKFQKKGK